MKAITLILSIIGLGAVCSAQAQEEEGYQVTGEVGGIPDGTRMYLIDGSRRRAIDSATVSQDCFTFRGRLKEPAHIYLYMGRGRDARKLADILLDNSTVQVAGSDPQYDSVRVSGSEIDRRWKEWYREDQRMGYQRYRIKQVSESLTGKNDTLNAAVLGKLVDEMQLDRINHLKAYVRRYRDSVTGAALPTLCTLSDYLTGADYLEMYRTLTPAWQQSTFGKSILVEAGKKRSPQGR